MALVSIYERGKISEVDTDLKKYRLLKPRPGLLTSFSNRAGSIVLGILLVLLGILSVWVIATQHPTTFQTIVLLLGACALPMGLWILVKAQNAYGKAARPHRFFAWDETEVILGETKPIGQAEIKGVLSAPKADRAAKLVDLGADVVKIPVAAIVSVEAHVGPPNLNIVKLRIVGADAAIKVDFDALLPSLNFSGINGDMAFNAISQYYSKATGTTLEASLGKT